jgi:putative PIN family toxin of toxin-antitoxin system
VRLVFDTNVIVAAVRSPSGAARWLLRKALLGEVSAIISVPLFLEYEAVLTRSEQLLASGLTVQGVHAVLDALASVGIHIRLSYRWRPLLTDANDDMVIETAINGGADFLVTFNVRDFGSAGDSFGCQALLPREAVKLLQG